MTRNTELTPELMEHIKGRASEEPKDWIQQEVVNLARLCLSLAEQAERLEAAARSKTPCVETLTLEQARELLEGRCLLVDTAEPALARLALSLAEENRRLREALEWYAEPSIYQQEHFEGTGMEYPALVDGGHSARVALSAAEAPAGRDG